ncbi:MAG: carbohydrate ABC transporter permease [Ruminococcus sp.]|nr:carbohydrate ABC transporter permease [Ruminococcus sp.]
MNFKKIKQASVYILLVLMGFFMIYPILWMISATFKTNSEIFGSVSLLIKKPVTDGYISIAGNYGGNINLPGAMLNSFIIIVPKVVFTVISSAVTAYGFGRFDFCGKKVLYALLLSTLFIPDTVMTIPQFIMFDKFGWIDSPLYSALTVPAFFAFEAYFVFMLIQFIKSVPREIDEAARIDGCTSWHILFCIILPLIRPALISCAIFQFIWTSNDFMGPLLYVRTPSRYPVSVFIKLFMDADMGFEFNRVFVITLISVLPTLIVFFIGQKFFEDGISAGSLKG